MDYSSNSQAYIWTVAEFLNFKIIDDDPKVLLVELEDTWLQQSFWLKYFEEQINSEDTTGRTHRVLAGDFPLELDYIKSAIA
jgi:hypothetical protein